MKLDVLKSNIGLLALLLLTGSALSAVAINQKPTVAINEEHLDLVSKMVAKIGPERTKEFINRLGQKKKTHAPIVAPAPVAPPAQTTQNPIVIAPAHSAPSVPPEHIVQPSSKEEQLISQIDEENFYKVIEELKIYAENVYNCISSFLNKANNNPYRSHVNCFKTQLKFIQEHLQHYPHPETTEGKKLFTLLKKTAAALEKSQDLMCQTLDNDYVKFPMGTVALGTALSKIQDSVSKQRSIINQQLGVLRTELRRKMPKEMLNELNTLHNMINAAFDYGSNKGLQELLSILSHRLKH